VRSFHSQYDLFLKNLNPIRRIRELAKELGRTRRERDQARTESEHRQEELERLQQENQRLREDLEAAQRAAKRQFAWIVDLLRSAEPKLLDRIPELAAQTALGSAGKEPAAPPRPPQRESVAERREVSLTPPPVLLPGLAAGERTSLFSSA
jgi:septal ring factor EnvC (AmiA/AmiB activator)